MTDSSLLVAGPGDEPTLGRKTAGRAGGSVGAEFRAKSAGGCARPHAGGRHFAVASRCGSG